MSNSTGCGVISVRIDLGHAQLDVGVDHVVGEHAAGLQERRGPCRGCRAPRAGCRTPSGSSTAPPAAGRTGSCPSASPGWILFVDAVHAGHQHRGKAEIRVGGGIGEADLDALGLRVRGVGDAARRRAVARGVGEQHGRLVARHQTLVGVGGRVGEGVDRLGVLQDAGDVVQAGVGEVGVLVAGEHRLAFLPDRLVARACPSRCRRTRAWA